MGSPALRSQALSLYRRILRAARTWPGPQEEVNYIRNEAQSTFRQNRALDDATEIGKQIEEGEHRLEYALHYHIPYPRLHNLPTGTFQRSRHRKAKPAYEPPSMAMGSLKDLENEQGASR
ncbi:hypothetical protein KFL_002410120 [Klebsormidium nitens]|uniref:Complex 1 LYR protein domain-containing protein n=1 Tax=Klebsormidium nitens TaxID=105231 RepID=A0A1Y1I8U5_KLENI|nr:hypothetical protein KFL_002410120 [Klebsormidium nitens]|eukprot:GAQ85561.1 hypothetical protein KFL_002410120 [Klebsormidium nitens]